MNRKTPSLCCGYVMNNRDNVGIALSMAQKGSQVTLKGEMLQKSILLTGDVPCGHKFALNDILTGTSIIKNGCKIGEATQLIRKGSWIHTHNMRSLYR